MPLIQDPRFRSLMDELPTVSEAEARLVADRNRPAWGNREDLRMHVGDWVEEAVTLMLDARYFLAAAKRAWEIGSPTVVDDDGELAYPEESEEHRRFCWASLVAALSALDKMAQLVNAKLGLGGPENKVTARWIEENLHLIQTQSADWYGAISHILQCEHVDKARKVRNYLVHRQNPLKLARVRIMENGTIELEFGQYWLAPDELQLLATRVLERLVDGWRRMVALL